MKYINRECQGEWRRNRIYQQFQYGRYIRIHKVTLWKKNWRLLCVCATQACLCALGGFPSKGQHKMCRNNADQRAQDQASHFWLISSVIINTSSWWWFHDRPSFVVALCREFIDIFLRLFKKNLRSDDDVKDGTRLRDKRNSAKSHKRIIESVNDIESVKIDCATFDKLRNAEMSVFVSSLD